MQISELSSLLMVVGQEFRTAGNTKEATACETVVKILDGVPDVGLGQLAAELIRLRPAKKTASKKTASVAAKSVPAPKKTGPAESFPLLKERYLKVQQDAVKGLLNDIELKEVEQGLNALAFPAVKEFCKTIGYSPGKNKGATLKSLITSVQLNQQRAYRR